MRYKVTNGRYSHILIYKVTLNDLWMENHIVRRKDLQLQSQEIQLQLRGVKSQFLFVYHRQFILTTSVKTLKRKKTPIKTITIVQITCPIVAKQYYVLLIDSQNNRVRNGECEKMTEFSFLS